MSCELFALGLFASADLRFSFASDTFHWERLTELTDEPLDILQFWFGWPGTYTQTHYDGVDNLISQFKGSKRVVLFPPEDVVLLKLHPMDHPVSRWVLHPDY